MRAALFIIILLSQQLLFSQNSSVNGKVTDESGQPIPFAHVRIDGTYSGTLTNLEGNFQLNLSNPSNSKLVISCVGFVPRTIQARTGKKMKILLQEDLVALQEVVIVPKDYARELVLSAIENIPKNYPSRDEIIKGFIRETLSKDSLGDSLHYISEAQTETSKASYEKSKSQDEVKLIKGRKLNIDTENLGIRIYAGAHLPHRFDLVISREGPLNPRKTKDYIYQIDDTVRYDDKALYRVGYLARNGKEYGTISIQEQTHAIVSIEQHQHKKKFKTSIKVNERQYLKSVTNYDIHEDHLWRLNYVQYSTKFTNGDSELYLNSMFTAHGFEEEIEKIEYADRIQFGDFLLEQVNEFDPDYWTDFNVTLPDERFDEAYEENPQAVEKESDEKEKKDFLFYLQKVEFGYSFRVLNTSAFAHDIVFNKGEIAIDETVADSNFNQWLISSTITYKMTDRSHISYQSSTSLTSDRSSDTYFGYTYRTPLRKGARTAISGSFGYNYMQFNRSIGEVSLVTNMKIGGKKIDADQVHVYSSSNTHSLLSSMSFIYEKSNRLKFQVSADHFTTLGGVNGLFFREDQGLFRRKEVFLENKDEGLNINSLNSLNFERNWGLRFGLILSF